MSDRDAKPVAWQHATMPETCSAGMHNIISDGVKELWLRANPRQVEHYTIPLYAAPAPAAEPPQDVAGLTQIGDESFNVPAILRQLQAEHDDTYGGSERTFIALIMRFVRSAAAALAALAREREEDQARAARLAEWLEQAERERDEALGLLRELVACKDLRDKQKAMAFVQITAETEAMRMEYERRKPSAWSAARAAIDAARKGEK